MASFVFLNVCVRVRARVCVCDKFIEILSTKCLCDAQRFSKLILVSNGKIH